MSWKFDQSVAKIFPDHARAHIPHYEEVLEQCLQLCSLYKNDAAIVDVGVATGETIAKLANAGFNHLYGIDNSQEMLNACPPGIATLINSDTFPESIKFDVILINWTLHFIESKQAYLNKVYDALQSGGALFISEKISNAKILKKFYYDLKRSHGVTEEEISAKEASLEGVMFINDIEWYLRVLKDLGFEEVYVVNAYWSFASFLCIKK